MSLKEKQRIFNSLRWCSRGTVSKEHELKLFLDQPHTHSDRFTSTGSKLHWTFFKTVIPTKKLLFSLNEENKLTVQFYRLFFGTKCQIFK